MTPAYIKTFINLMVLVGILLTIGWVVSALRKPKSTPQQIQEQNEFHEIIIETHAIKI